MRGSFFEFNNAVSALFVAKGALNVTSHNIANAAIKGYSRQYAEMRANIPLSTGSIKGMVPTGAEFYGIGQIRDFFLDKKLWTHSATLGEFQVKRQQLTMTQTIFNEMSETGLVAQINDLERRLQDLMTNAGDATYRTNVIQQADALATHIRSTYENLQKQQRDIDTEIRSVVQNINSLGRQIVSLNKQIQVAEYTGDRANDLRDQRARLIDALSVYVNVEVREIEMNEDFAKGMYPEPEERMKSQKRMIIQINGDDFINHFTLNTLEARERRDESTNVIQGLYRNPEDVSGLVDVYWGTGDFKFDLYSPSLGGMLKGLVDIRDGNNGYYAVSTDYEQTGVKIHPPDSKSGQILTLNFAAKDGRVDILEDGGFLRFIEPRTGIAREYRYLSAQVEYHYDANGVVTGATAVLEMSPVTQVPPHILDNPGRYEARIGQTVGFKGIPYYLSKINEMVRTLANGFNFGTNMKGQALTDVTGHANAYDANNMNMGMLFFTYQRMTVMPDGRMAYRNAICYDRDNDGIGDGSGSLVRNPEHIDSGGNFINPQFQIFRLNALNFKVNDALITNPYLMACATAEKANTGVNPPGSGDVNSGKSENHAVFGFINLLKDKSLFREGTLGDFIIGMAGELGIDAKQAIKFERNYLDVTASVEYQRMSVSGVDIDEEITDMIRFQQQFMAATKLINVIDQIYDTLINRLGYL
jgi:flagellar hook-associated protein 1 FlgK